MVYTLITSLLLFNSLDCGVQYGFNLPISNIGRYYSLTTSPTVFCRYNKFQIDYVFTKYIGKSRNGDYLYIHTVSGLYQVPIFPKAQRSFNLVFGGTYNQILHHFEQGKEKNYVWGIKSGIDYQKVVSRFYFNSHLYLNQIIHPRTYQSLKIYHTDYFISLMIGIGVNLLAKP
ncbi:MAG: hypothetical protein N2201_04485 [candidate division WOR-3 bacterium]|nr:hypothetical protein [candidate division WOR-3 bacterium]